MARVAWSRSSSSARNVLAIGTSAHAHTASAVTRAPSVINTGRRGRGVDPADLFPGVPSNHPLRSFGGLQKSGHGEPLRSPRLVATAGSSGLRVGRRRDGLHARALSYQAMTAIRPDSSRRIARYTRMNGGTM